MAFIRGGRSADDTPPLLAVRFAKKK
jgi:hypothetical protein